jgi:hypothetical protein
MNFEELEYKAKMAQAAFPDWTPLPVLAGKDGMRTFPWVLKHKEERYIPTLVAEHIAAVQPLYLFELLEEIRKRDVLIDRAKEFASELGTVPYDWTEHASVSYREVQIEKSTIVKTVNWLVDVAKLKSKS